MAEKFRPKQISDVLGQDVVKNLIRRSLVNNAFPQFSLMYGPSGTGKSTLAEIAGLSLTCDNPQLGEPCLCCQSCKDNLTQLESGGNTLNLCKVNMGAIERSDFKQTIKEVFTLKPALNKKAVYIFEEIQALTKDEQNILLEYISGMPKDIHVIACTTEFTKLRQELRNRATKFAFKQLKMNESLQLISNICKQKNIPEPSAEIAKFLIRTTHNCPREIVNTIDFLSSADSFDGDTLTEFLGYISNSVYIEYFRQCKEDTFKFAEWLESKAEVGYMNMVRGLKEFTIDLYGYIFGGNVQYFSIKERKELKEIFQKVDEDKLGRIMEYFNNCKCDDDVSAKYNLIAGRRYLLGQTEKSIMHNSKADAIKTSVEADKKASHLVTKPLTPQPKSIDDISDILSQLNVQTVNRPNNVG